MAALWHLQGLGGDSGSIGGLWNVSRVSSLPAVLNTEACCDKTEIAEPGASREQKISSVSIYLKLIVFKSKQLKKCSFCCFGV